MVAKVDDDDFEALSRFKWYASKGNGKVWRACCMVPMHVMVKRVPKGFLVEHKDRDGLNNQKTNLRKATNSQNQANIPKRTNRPMQSRYKGVSWGCGKDSWRARVTRNGKKHSLGTFRTEEDAARAYDAAALRMFGEFAFLNFPTEVNKQS